jgi:hypothetical protein
VSRLPPLLQPWIEELTQLPDEVADAVGAWLPRLSLLVGPLRGAPTLGDGEPDGFDGLSRRGSWERLLTSEWAIADAAPLEFLRRAAQREQLFLKPRRLEPAGSRRSVLLLDAGPMQLGGPRLAQLAALVVFARRAAAAGAEFGWGVLQGGPQPLKVLDEDSLAALAIRRTLAEVSADELAAWRVELEDVDDLWIARSALDAYALDGARVLALDEVAEPDRRFVRVRASIELELPLPDADAGAQLLRGLKPKAQQKRHTTAPIDATHGLRFSQDGHRLLAVQPRGDRRRIVAFHVPDNSRAKPGKPRFVEASADTPIGGVSFRGKRFGVVVRSGEQLQWFNDRVYGWRDPQPVGPASRLPFERGQLRPMVEYALPSGQRAWSLVGAEGQLHWSDPNVATGSTAAVQLWPDVLDGFVVASGEAGAVELARYDRHGRVATARRFEADEPEAVFGFPGWGLSHAEWGLCAVREAANRWRLHFADHHERRNDVPMRVFGDVVAAARDFRHEFNVPGLVTLDAERRRLTLHRVSGGSRPLASFPAPVACLAVNALRPQIAVLLQTGELRVRSIQEDCDLLVIHPEAP